MKRQTMPEFIQDRIARAEKIGLPLTAPPPAYLCVPKPPSPVFVLEFEEEEDDFEWDPRDDYDPEDIPGSRFDPECEDDPM